MASEADKLPPVHPGETLLLDCLEPMGLSQSQLARDIGVSPRRISEIVHGNRPITADIALRLARYLGTSAEYWMNLQGDYDLDVARDELQGRLENEVPIRAA